MLESFGRVLSCTILIDQKLQVSRGFGFAVFEKVEAALRVCSTPIHWKGRDLHISRCRWFFLSFSF